VILPIWAYGAAALVLAAGGFIGGYRVSTDHWKAQLVTAQVEHDEEIRHANLVNNAIAAQLEESRANVRTVYKTITKRVEKIVDRPVYVRECFDDDGLSIANDALRGQAPDPGKPDRPVSGVKPAGG